VEIIYRLIFYKEAQKDITHWRRSGNKQAIKKILILLKLYKKTLLAKAPVILRN